MPLPEPSPNAYLQAVDWFRQRVPMTESDFARLEAHAHERAFTVAGVAQIDLVQDVWSALDKALAQGDTLEDFQDAVSTRLSEAWGGEQPWRVETVMRTNLQHAYSRGRWEQQSDPDVKELRPFWEFSAIMDLRTTEVCRVCEGTVLNADDPWWQQHNPPLHHQCRSTVISLTPEQAKARGVAVEAPASAPADGFGAAPGSDDWHPDLTKYAHELAAVAQAKEISQAA